MAILASEMEGLLAEQERQKDNRKVYTSTLLHDAYYGTGLFENGVGIRQHPRESVFNYNDRKALAYYLNYMAPIVNAGVDPIYKDAVRRDYRSTDMFEAFLKDCDRAGTNFQDFCHSAATDAKLYGAVYVVVDNSDVQDEVMPEAVKNRHLPFLKAVKPSQIEDWEIDDYGRISSFTYKETIQTGLGKYVTRTYTWTANTWTIADEKETVQGTHSIGRVPIVQWTARNTDKRIIKPPSEYISVAQANYFLYQLCSWHTQILRDQAFNILTMPDTGNSDIVVGTNNVLVYPPESTHTPSFIAPSAAPADMLTAQMDRIIKEMFRMSGLESIIGVQTDNSKSGVAKQWDFEKTNRRLADFAGRCEAADKSIIALYELWSNEKVDYSCEYPRDFKINDITDSLTDAQAALDLNFDSVTYKQEVLKKVLTAYMPNLDAETYDRIIDEVMTATADKTMNRAYGDIDINGFEENATND